MTFSMLTSTMTYFFYLVTDFGWKVCLCHNVTRNAFEFLTLISNLFDNRRKWKFDFWKTVGNVNDYRDG